MFHLINPVIVGDFQTHFTGVSPLDAAKIFWKKFSGLIVNDVPQMCFTLRENSGILHHFSVKETITTGNITDYSITPIKLALAENAVIALNETYDKMLKQIGGKKKRYDTDDSTTDDSSSDSDDELVSKFNKIKNKLRRNQPIMYYHYIPSIYNVSNLYIPTFVYPIAPYVEIGFSTAFWE